jgi:hypothetical protein
MFKVEKSRSILQSLDWSFLIPQAEEAFKIDEVTLNNFFQGKIKKNNQFLDLVHFFKDYTFLDSSKKIIQGEFFSLKKDYPKIKFLDIMQKEKKELKIFTPEYGFKIFKEITEKFSDKDFFMERIVSFVTISKNGNMKDLILIKEKGDNMFSLFLRDSNEKNIIVDKDTMIPIIL